MINYKESKQVRIDSWLLKLFSRDMKTKGKNKDQPTNSYKNNRQVKPVGNITPTMDHYPRNGWMRDTDP